MSNGQRILVASLFGLAIVATVVATVAAIWWFGKSDSQLASGNSRPRDRSLTLIVSGDTRGWIIPCGCTSNQSGGLLRRGSFVSAIRKHSSVILADAGGAPGGTSPYQRVKFEAILKGEIAMGLTAHNLGGPEVKLGADYLRHVAKELKAPFLSANLRDAEGDFIADPYRMVEAGIHRVLIVGVISKRFQTPKLRIDDPREAILGILDTVTDKYDRLVVLAYLPEDELRKLASELPEADVVVGGPTGQSLIPTRVGPCLLASATNKGRFLVELNLQNRNGEQNHIAGQTWSGRVVEMTADFDDHPAQRKNLKAFHTALSAADFSAEETGFVPLLSTGLPPDYRLAGTKSCFQCHRNDCTTWQESKHAHAWQTLADQNAHVDSYCQQCHTTGFGLPGGFQSAKRSRERYSVGCESCHGPSQAHVDRPLRKTPFVARDQCTLCHDRENSPVFEYADYWQAIEHGHQALWPDAPARKQESNVETRP